MSSKDCDRITIYGKQGRSKCGYCKTTPDGLTSFGFKCDSMKPINYMNIMDRGFRRCGTYYYKNYNDVICCPMYTIRCKTNDLILTKSQRKTLKHFREYLISGKTKSGTIKLNARGDEIGSNKDNKRFNINNNKSDDKFNPGKDKTQKAKYKRYQLKLNKLKIRAEKENKNYDDLLTEYENRRATRKDKFKPKSLSELLDYSNLKDPAHRFEIKTLLCHPMSANFNTLLKTEHKLYQNYQVAIHKDQPYEVEIDQFKRFLVKGGLISKNSPQLIQIPKKDTTFPLGQYHQQYWIDSNLVAVGVIDILPNCLSSVYLFYDPNYSFLNLGVYSALNEINFINKLQKEYQKPEFNYYYMGFYIHNCQKMRYKGQYIGSELLCPETYTWIPIDKCKVILDKVKYARFADKDVSVNDEIKHKTQIEIASLVKVELNKKIFSLKELMLKYNLDIVFEAANLIGFPTLNDVIFPLS